MKWLTLKQIRSAAKESDEAAFDCAIEHWEQLATATLEELSKAFRNRRVSIGYERCALCIRYQKPREAEPCRLCPVAIEAGGCLNTPYESAHYEWRLLHRIYRTPAAPAQCEAFQEAAQDEAEFLKSLRTTRRPE